MMNTENNNPQLPNDAKKNSTWEFILKLLIALASAFLGVVGGQAMNHG